MIRKPNSVCYRCSKPCYKRPSEISEAKGKRVFCSRQCYGIESRKPIPCPVCGKEILRSKHRKTCSTECANKNRTGIKYKRRSELDPESQSGQQFARQLLIMDRGASCERCGYKEYPEILQSHHKIARAHGGRTVMGNLELLCPTCHCVEHSVFRKGKNGRRAPE